MRKDIMYAYNSSDYSDKTRTEMRLNEKNRSKKAIFKWIYIYI